MSRRRVQEMLKILDKYGYTLADLSELFDSISNFDCSSNQFKDDEKKESHANVILTEEEKKQINLKIRITNLLLELGFSTHVRGFIYTRDAIITTYNNPNYYDRHIIKLYSELGNKYKSSSKSIERGIRYSIEAAWDCNDVNIYEKYFGCSIDADRGKPSNSQFIYTIAEYLKLHP